MALARQLLLGLRVILRRHRADRDLDAELDAYADEAAAAHIAAGATADEARRRVRLEIGSRQLVREQVRDGGWEQAIVTTIGDVRYALRRLRRDAAFTVVAVLTLAVGIGGATAIFSAVDPILFEPLPYARADRLVSVSDRTTDGAALDVTFGTFREVATRSRAFDAVAVTKPWQPTLADGAAPERLEGQRVSAAYFRVLGVTPARGRDFDSLDDRAGGPHVVVIGHGLWQRRFGGDPAIVGRLVRLDGEPFTVVGVMPAGFEVVQTPDAEAWAPLQYDEALPPDGREWGHHLRMTARLRPDVGLKAAREDLEAIARDPVPPFRRAAWASMRQGLAVVPLRDELVGGVRPVLMALIGAVLLVLAVACVNVMNLLIARGGQRRAELVMRTALGASRARIVRQLVTESVVLALAGGAGGVLIAFAGVRGLAMLAPAGLPRADAIRLDATALAFAMLVSTVVGVVVGLVPAWQTTGRERRGDSLQVTRTVAGRRVASDALVVAEVALALVLTIVAGLLVRSMQRLLAVDPGFAPAHVLTMQVRATTVGSDALAVQRFFDRALDAVRALPDVEAAGWTSELPLTRDYEKYGVRIESIEGRDTARDQSALRYAVTPGYFDAMGLRLRRGRWLDARDRRGAAPEVLVSESFARHRLAGRDALGQHVRVGRTDSPSYTIVGVVADVKHASLAVEEADAVYVSVDQWSLPEPVLSLVVKAAVTDAAGLAPAVRAAIWSVDREQPIVRVATVDALVAASTGERRFALTIFECFALAALALAATGIYGVLSGSVAERMREMGVRAALGASRGELLALVFGRGMAMAATGVLCGAVVAVGAGRAVAALLFGIAPFDGPTYGAAVLLLVAVAALACWAPAWRASRVDPATMLRVD